ncbi:beta-phosphoglucomutase-like phosphatase (HAD superfamily) [Kibdelosporangium banguiense]|uniref:Beta-phosphoglucomutase-like phosphatase (HAD superfamily) n=1 Tax=Kibdelosporangium banguiense TaxID=1365924 RepID=A0ABS4T956_9PSEU|nr:HAD hydrolase-like protein [Kibdelosporangium banguiense]MBP2320378.1 beta-phosphoglucomutase-like phosphatase (HAD superfamily) [Kibdelosporangium banguiense]
MRDGRLLTERDHVLVALDGPIAELPPPPSAADRLRVMVAEGGLPRKVARTDDPFVVIAHAATIGPATEQAVHAQLCRIELEVLSTAPATAGVHKAFAKMAAVGTQITVVTSLSITAVRTFLVLHGLLDHVRHLTGRTGPDSSGLPPAPDLITAAIHHCAIPMRSCLFVGSTDTDLKAARAAGVETIRPPWSDDALIPPPVPVQQR